MREFIDDSDCMNYLATALDSSIVIAMATHRSGVDISSGRGHALVHPPENMLGMLIPYSMSPHVNRTEGALGSSSCRRRRGREWMDIGEKDKDVLGQRLAAVKRRRQVVHAVGVVDELSRQTHDQLVAALDRQLM